MLFDLQGPRKTFVKAIYLGLAILMAGGLVLFGIGSDVNGGLADVFGGSPTGDIRSSVEDGEKAVQQDPKNKVALEDLIADRYALAGAEENFDPETGEFSEEGKQQLEAASKNWTAYLKLTDNKPDVTTASYAVSAFLGLQDAEGATEAQEFITQQEPNAANYLALMLYALYAGNQVVASGAEQQALKLAEGKAELKEVKDQIKQAKDEIGQRNEEIQKQIQEQFAQQNQQSQGGGIPSNPFQGAGTGAAGN